MADCTYSTTMNVLNSNILAPLALTANTTYMTGPNFGLSDDGALSFNTGNRVYVGTPLSLSATSTRFTLSTCSSLSFIGPVVITASTAVTILSVVANTDTVYNMRVRLQGTLIDLCGIYVGSGFRMDHVNRYGVTFAGDPPNARGIIVNGTGSRIETISAFSGSFLNTNHYALGVHLIDNAHVSLITSFTAVYANTDGNARGIQVDSGSVVTTISDFRSTHNNAGGGSYGLFAVGSTIMTITNFATTLQNTGGTSVGLYLDGSVVNTISGFVATFSNVGGSVARGIEILEQYSEIVAGSMTFDFGQMSGGTRYGIYSGLNAFVTTTVITVTTQNQASATAVVYLNGTVSFDCVDNEPCVCTFGPDGNGCPLVLPTPAPG